MGLHSGFKAVVCELYPDAISKRVASFQRDAPPPVSSGNGVESPSVVILDTMCLIHQFSAGHGYFQDTIEDELVSFFLAKILAVAGVPYEDFVLSNDTANCPPCDVVMVCDVTERITKAKTDELSMRNTARQGGRERRSHFVDGDADADMLLEDADADAMLDGNMGLEDEARVRKVAAWEEIMSDRALRMATMASVGARLADLIMGEGQSRSSFFPRHIRVWMHGWGSDPASPREGTPACYASPSLQHSHPMPPRLASWQASGGGHGGQTPPPLFGEADTCIAWWARMFAGHPCRIVTTDTDIVAICMLMLAQDGGGSAPYTPARGVLGEPAPIVVELTHYDRGSGLHLGTHVCVRTLLHQVVHGNSVVAPFVRAENFVVACLAQVGGPAHL